MIVVLKTQVFFENAVTYLAEAPDGLTAANITGVWLSTDDDEAYDEVECCEVPG